jgi:hypothetical protein
MKKYILALAIVISSLYNLKAQTVNQNSGWLMFVNNTKINNKWGIAFDAQFRSAADWKYVRNVLIRPGATYYMNDRNNVTLGYLFTTTHSNADGLAKNTLIENRIFEQYIFTHKLASIFASHRFRLEQRFIETQGDAIFSQRLRYFFRLIQPLAKQQEAFNKGAFVALQNETFFNVQNKAKLNDSFFDQNRAYLALGYRFSKKFDVEAGYLNQASHGLTNNTINHVAQLAVYTRF